MDIKVTKDEKEYVFKYSKDTINAGRTKSKPITFHKWICEELPEGKNEAFYGVDHSDAKSKSLDELREQAEKDIQKLLN